MRFRTSLTILLSSTLLLLAVSVSYANTIPSVRFSFPYLSYESPSSGDSSSCVSPTLQDSIKAAEESTRKISEQIIGKKEHYVLRALQHYSIEKNKNLSGTLITLRLHPDDWETYYALQQEIAKIIPEENKRPTIDLTLTTSQEDVVQKSIGIAGGMGPLSDSEVLKSLMEEIQSSPQKIDWNHFAINLLSAPPPRSSLEKLTRLSYYKRVLSFATRGHHRYYMVSNTAHSNIGKFQAMVASTTARFNTLKPNAVQDLADYVASQASLKIAGENPEVLILGTVGAYQEDLYPSYLSKKGLSSPQRERIQSPLSDQGSFYSVGSLTRAERLQNYIDLAKQGNLTEAGEKVSEFILSELKFLQARGRSVNRIILGCTELPLVLKGEVMERLEEKLKNFSKSKIEFLNTEALFSHKIAEDVRKLNSQ